MRTRDWPNDESRKVAAFIDGRLTHDFIDGLESNVPADARVDAAAALFKHLATNVSRPEGVDLAVVDWHAVAEHVVSLHSLRREVVQLLTERRAELGFGNRPLPDGPIKLGLTFVDGGIAVDGEIDGERACLFCGSALGDTLVSVDVRKAGSMADPAIVLAVCSVCNPGAPPIVRA